MTPEALAATHAAAFLPGDQWSAAAFAALLAQPGVLLTGDALAFVLARVTLDEGEILTLATDPACHRQGLALAALHRMFALAAGCGASRMFLEVAADNLAALGLYQRAGFVPNGRRRGYYRRPDGCRVDAILMARPLTAESSGVRAVPENP